MVHQFRRIGYGTPADSEGAEALIPTLRIPATTIAQASSQTKLMIINGPTW